MSGSIYQAATEISVGEKDGSVTVTFLRSGDLSHAVNVTYDVTTESATAGTDFIGQSGVVRFEVGQSQANLNFQILDDNQSEATETFVVGIVSVDSGVMSVPRTARVNILDDENPVLPPVDPPLVSPYRVDTETLVGGLSVPLNFEFSPVNPDIIYVAEKAGVIRTRNVKTGEDLGIFLDISSMVNDYGDRGVLDIAIHPDFPAQPYIYVSAIIDPANANPDTRGNRYAQVIRYTADASSGYLKAVPNSGTVILGNTGRALADISGNGALDFTNPLYENNVSSERYLRSNDPNPPKVVDGFKQNYWRVDSVTHAGGSLAFGPDGMLYVSTGDGGSPNYADPKVQDVQNLNSLAGKILRIDPLTGKGKADNPFYTSGMSLDDNKSKVWQYGLRNPFSIGFDSLGRLFITDTGWNAYEEINYGQPGANFGWPYYEGKEGGQLAQTSGYKDFANAQAFYAGVANGTIQVTAPYTAFGHATSVPGYQNQVITGGAVIYNGDKYPAALQNDYFFTNFEGGHTFTVDTNNRTEVNYLFTSSPLAPIHFKQGPDGYVYYASMGSGDPSAYDGSIGRIYINDLNAAQVTVSAGPAVKEGSGVQAQATFTLSAAQAVDTIITYSTWDGTAKAGSDFTGKTNATATIAAGQTSITVPITILNDSAYESTETFQVRLEGATAGSTKLTAFGGAVLTIRNDDIPPPGSQLLYNGSFEELNIPGGSSSYASIPGWTPLAGGFELWKAHRNVTATDGINFAELDFQSGWDGFYQDVDTVAGQSHTLTFDLRKRADKPLSTPADVQILWNGVVVATTTPGTDWGSFTVSNLIGTGGTDRLTIREVQSQSADGLGALVDNFRLITAGTPQPSVSISATPATVAEASGANAIVTFTLNAVQSTNVIVTYSTVNGTAGAGSDFTGKTNATATILAGQTSVTAQIPLINDSVAEPSETFSVNLVGATMGGNAIAASGSATFTITDNDPAAASVSIAATPASIAEANGANATVTFTLNAVQANDVVVTYSTANGTATAGSDFTGATNATATILAGQTSVTAQIPLINDSVAEPSETFSVNLVGATMGGNAIAASGNATFTITDNDAPPSGSNLLANGSFEATTTPVGSNAYASIPGWTALSSSGVELWRAHRNVTATDGVNFSELDNGGEWDGIYQDVQTIAGQSHTLTFDLRKRADKPLTTPADVQILWNGVVVATTTPGTNWGSFTVSNLVGTGGLDRLTIREVQSQSADGLGALVDNFKLVSAAPPAPIVSVAATPTSVAEANGANATITFSLNAAQSNDVIVTYSTANGTATAGSDFTAKTNATATILAGQTSVTAQIALIDDNVAEPSETFSVNLVGATMGGNAVQASGSATITITDSDVPPPATNLLVNGSFEATTTPVGSTSYATIPGWTALPGSSFELWKNHRSHYATDGVNFAELDFAGAWDGFYQDVQTVAGESHTLTFDFRKRSDKPLTTPSDVEILWNGTVVATATPGANWGSFTVSNLVGTGGLDRLTIREVQSQSADGLGALVDNFKLVSNGAAAASTLVAKTAIPQDYSTTDAVIESFAPTALASFGASDNESALKNTRADYLYEPDLSLPMGRVRSKKGGLAKAISRITGASGQAEKKRLLSSYLQGFTASAGDSAAFGESHFKIRL